jgi:putative phage-type endonuclease
MNLNEITIYFKENIEKIDEDVNKMNEIIQSSLLDCDEISSVNSSITTETDIDDSEEYLYDKYDKWVSTLPKDILLELENVTYDMIDDYINYEVLSMSSPSFHDDLVYEISLLLHQQLKEIDIYNCKDENIDEIQIFVKQISETYFENGDIPPRSFETTLILQSPDINEMKSKIDNLRNLYQPKQKTLEWYEYRHGLITASNIWKIFKNDNNQNSIICEKCRPFVSYENSYVNVSSSLHWGVKYEPLSAMLYEYKYNTIIEDFGCIKHPKYHFIGASPDGINIDTKSDRYGRMIEIKNIVNRSITLTPKEEYWIQMQVQMETCDLDECDFIETRFKEYENEDQFYSTDIEIPKPEFRGVILYFIEKRKEYINMDMNVFKSSTSSASTPFYKYMPLTVPVTDKVQIDEWINTTVEELKNTHILQKPIYWYLDEFSCILVKRNKKWFQKALPKIEETWKIIEKEKLEGFEHRIPKKKNKTEVIHSSLEEIIKNDIKQSMENEQKTFIKNLPQLNNINVIKLQHDLI